MIKARNKTVGIRMDFSDHKVQICKAVRPYTLTTVERISAVIDAAKYIIKNQIEGAFVECGVRKGGSTMAMALTLCKLDKLDRDLYLL